MLDLEKNGMKAEKGKYCLASGHDSRLKHLDLINQREKVNEAGGEDGLCKQLMRTTEKGIFLLAPILPDWTLEVNCSGIKVPMITGLIMGWLPGLS